ncbi:SGNH/GDSL hydrolase family protein [Microbacterium oxydans]|nr:SGNH/GDSL hydrolase family protein [Microbacterium oxydans]
MINTAITRWRADLILADFEGRVACWRPDVVTLLIGTNDCTTRWLDPVIEVSEFADSVAGFVRRVRELGAVPVLQTPPPADLSHAPDRAHRHRFAQAIRDVAAAEEAILVDQSTRRSPCYYSAGTGPGNEGTPWGCSTTRSTRAPQVMPCSRSAWPGALGLAGPLGLDAEDSRVVTDLQARVALARHPHWPPA